MKDRLYLELKKSKCGASAGPEDHCALTDQAGREAAEGQREPLQTHCQVPRGALHSLIPQTEASSVPYMALASTHLTFRNQAGTGFLGVVITPETL